ncbi:MAG: LemA family protein [Bacteroidaceae bacterium]|nr:LemA family protein [Bacteroidaceae bacterium]
MTNKNWIILGAIAVIAMWAISTYNGLVNKEETVNQAWGDVEAAYQRRMDLIPQLVNTVKGYASHEENTLKEVTEMRTKATQMTISIDSLTEESMERYQKMQEELQGSLSRLMAITEAYPDLKANENFLTLQSQLEGSENRINEVRKAFNAVVQEYNVAVRRFPASILSGIFGFDKKPMFKAQEGADKAPEVKF